MNAPSLFLSQEELTRAKNRIASGNPQWKQIADDFFDKAQAAYKKEHNYSKFDSSWFDIDPDQPYSQTYEKMHQYARPAEHLLVDAALIAKAALLGIEDADRYRSFALKLTEYVLDNFSFHVMHHDSGLIYHHIIRAMGDLYLMLADLLTDAQKQKFIDQLTSGGQAAINCNLHWQKQLAYMPYNNHLAFHRSAMLMCGILLDKKELIEAAFQAPGSPEHMLEGCVTDDGLCYESSTLYHYATFGGLCTFAELTRLFRPLGRNVYEEVYADGRSLKQMLDAPINMMMLNGERPSFGDCYTNRPKFCQPQKGHYERAYAIWKDPVYAWIINKTPGRGGISALFYGVDEVPAGKAPSLGSRIWIEHGWALTSSRSGEDYFNSVKPGGFSACINGDKSCVHNHRDKFTIQLADSQHMWLEDAECRSLMLNGFSDPMQEQFSRSGWAHNLVIVDGAEQQMLKRPLSFIRHRTSEGESSVTLADLDGKVFPDTAMIRSIVTSEDYSLDVFDVDSANGKTLDWVIHPNCESSDFDTEMIECNEPENFPCPLLKKFRSSKLATNTIAGEFTAENRKIKLNLLTSLEDQAAKNSLELFYATWPTISDDSKPRKPMYFLRVSGKAKACFVALYQHDKDNSEKWEIRSFKRVFNGSENELRVGLKSGSKVKHYVLPGI